MGCGKFTTTPDDLIVHYIRAILIVSLLTSKKCKYKDNNTSEIRY